LPKIGIHKQYLCKQASGNATDVAYSFCWQDPRNSNQIGLARTQEPCRFPQRHELRPTCNEQSFPGLRRTGGLQPTCAIARNLRAAMKGAWSWFIIIFFVLHIPLTLMLDAQVSMDPNCRARQLLVSSSIGSAIARACSCRNCKMILPTH